MVGEGYRSTGKRELAGRKLRRDFPSVVKICGFSENKEWAEPEPGQCLSGWLCDAILRWEVRVQ
jgi:hypothetical protein